MYDICRSVSVFNKSKDLSVVILTIPTISTKLCEIRKSQNTQFFTVSILKCVSTLERFQSGRGGRTLKRECSARGKTQDSLSATSVVLGETPESERKMGGFWKCKRRVARPVTKMCGRALIVMERAMPVRLGCLSSFGFS